MTTVMGIEMAFFGWLFGSRKTPVEPEIEPKRFVYPAAPPDAPRAKAILRDSPAPSRPLAPTVVDRFGNETFDIDYKTENAPERRRRVEILFGSPGNLVTGVDLAVRRLRTYRVDRIKLLTKCSTGETFEPTAFFTTHPATLASTLPADNTPNTASHEIRRAMYCQLSLLKLVATADGPMTATNCDRIMEYVKRENRFATREGWVQTGDKRAVWPEVRKLIDNIEPRREHIDVYVGTLRENWDNSRRFSVLNDALASLANQSGNPSPTTVALVTIINRGGGQQ